MARTNWGPIILGMGLLGGGIYVFTRWDEVCPKIMGAAKCKDNPIETLVEHIEEYNSRPSCNDPNNRTSNCRSTGLKSIGSRATGPTTYTYGSKSATPGKTITQAQASKAMVNRMTTQGGKCKPGESYLPSTGKCFVKKPSSIYTGYTNFNSFNTFTLNRMSVR